MTSTSTGTSDCGCGGAAGAGSCGCNETGFAERPRFFPRQMVTPDDLTLGQDYLRNKIRRHNRYLHGWGVVCGAKVSIPAGAQPWKVVVSPGYILGPFGDEIMIDRERCFDLRTRCLTGITGDPCAGDVPDPLCAAAPATPKSPVLVAVRYKDMMARAVRVQPVGCGCDDTLCEYSRWQDGYEICTLEGPCPASHVNPPDLNDLIKPHAIPECPTCATDPWVVLATVTVDAKGAVTAIDNCSCRRMVLSLAPYWTKCTDPAVVQMKPSPNDQAPAAPKNPAGTGGTGKP